MVVPLSRPSQLTNVLHNFWRQRYEEKRLFIVESGAAIGVCARYGVEPTILVSRQTTIAEALNLAVDELTRRVEHQSWVCKIDDDDYYGPGYLSQIAGAPLWADVVGKSRVWMKTRGDRLRLFDYPTDETGIITGPTIACRVGQCAEFPDVRPYGEDVGWLVAMRESGAKFHVTNQRYFCQRRWAWPHPHTWDATDKHALSLANRVHVYDAGQYDEDIVNGYAWPRLRLVQPETPSIEECPGFANASRLYAEIANGFDFCNNTGQGPQDYPCH